MPGKSARFEFVAQELIEKRRPRLKRREPFALGLRGKGCAERAHDGTHRVVYAEPYIVHQRAEKFRRYELRAILGQKLENLLRRVAAVSAIINCVSDSRRGYEIYPLVLCCIAERHPMSALKCNVKTLFFVIFNEQPPGAPALVVAAVGADLSYQSIHR